MRKLILLSLALLALGAAGALTAWSLVRVGVAQGYAPDQPIAFSHQLHAGEHQIPCLYCHFGAETSRHAGIPPSRVCMSCHTELAIQTLEIAKLKEAVAQNRPIRWIKVHNLPDFVYFNHAQHVRIAGLECQSCHGAVETMDTLRQEAPLTMGWCLDCHRERGVDGHGGAPPEVATGGPERATGGLDCSKCHY